MNLAFSECVAPHWDRCIKKSWPLKAAPFLVVGAESKKTAPNLRLGFWDWQPACLNFKIRREWECLALRAVTPFDDEIPSPQDVAEQPTEITHSTRFHKDLNYLPSE